MIPWSYNPMDLWFHGAINYKVNAVSGWCPVRYFMWFWMNFLEGFYWQCIYIYVYIVYTLYIFMYIINIRVREIISLKNVNFFIYWPILIKFDFYEGGWGGGGPFIINFYLNYYWWTFANVMFQISSKSLNKWRIRLFWGRRGGPGG